MTLTKKQVIQAQEQLNSLMAESPAAPLTMGATVEMCIRQGERTQQAIVKFLNGDSPTDSPMMDRAHVIIALRLDAAQLHLHIPPTVKDRKLAQLVSKRLKRNGIQVNRQGRVSNLLTAPKKPEADDGGNDAE